MPFIFDFLHSQWFAHLPVPDTSFKDKTVIVTGSNTGLGREAARHVARLGASKVIIAVRSIEKGNKAKAEIEQSTSCGSSVIEVWPLDLSSYESVIEFGERCNRELARLDFALLNAAVASWTYSKAEDNETTITVNVVSTFLLAFMLLPKLKETATKHNTRPALSITSSEVHFFTPFTERNAPDQGKDIFQVLNDPATAKMNDRYNISKMLEVLTVREMAARSTTSGDYPVTINTMNPGFCYSELRREASRVLQFIFFLMESAIARTSEQGSRCLVNGALIGHDSHGQYLSDCKVVDPAPLVLSEDGKKAQKRVYEELVKKLEAIRPGVTANL